MAERKRPSLTNILAEFRKTAEEDNELIEEAAPAVVDEDEVAPEAECENCDQPTAEDVAAAAQNVEDAEEQLVDAKDALDSITDDFINEHTAALAKEAQMFGEIFAASCMEQMNKTAALEEIRQNAYAATREVAEESMNFNKQAALYEAAYVHTMAKLAGFEDEQQMADARGVDQITPEGAAALAQEAQDAPDYDEGYDEAPEEDAPMSGEELAELTNSLGAGDDTGSIAEALNNAAEAADSNADAIKSIAEAAEAIAENNAAGEDYGDVGEEESDPEEVAQQAAQDAYEETMAALGGGQ